MGDYPELSWWTQNIHESLYKRKAEGDFIIEEKVM